MQRELGFLQTKNTRSGESPGFYPTCYHIMILKYGYAIARAAQSEIVEGRVWLLIHYDYISTIGVAAG